MSSTTPDNFIITPAQSACQYVTLPIISQGKYVAPIKAPTPDSSQVTLTLSKSELDYLIRYLDSKPADDLASCVCMAILAKAHDKTGCFDAPISSLLEALQDASDAIEGE